MSAPYTELDQPLEDTALLCRGCLAESGEMKDMVEWGLTQDFYRFTDVQVDSSEGLSQLLCTACEDVLVKCKDFQNRCWNSDLVLRDIAKKKTEDQASTAEETSFDEDAQNTVLDEDKTETTISCFMYVEKLVIMISAADNDSKIILSCPYKECVQKCMKKSDLLHHLSKYHNITDKYTIELQYHCIHTGCAYHADSETKKWFASRKYLNQHYNKVHKSKCFSCDTCKQKFSTRPGLNRHTKTCSLEYPCSLCDVVYNSHESFMVHLMRRHPDLHRQYKDDRKAGKRKAKIEVNSKKSKVDEKDSICDSPKRSFATQTLRLEDNIKNDVTLSPWFQNSKTDYKTDEISTQTVFEDLLSLKSQNSEDESLFCSESVSLSDIQTQTFPLEFGLSRSNKETLTSETQSPDFSIKETQTCYCLYDSPKMNYRLFDSVSSSPSSINLTSTQTQTSEKSTVTSCDVMLSCNTIETQTYFEECDSKDGD